MVVVMITNLINVANAQALNTKFKGNISTIYSKDGKNLEVIRDGKKILSVTRKNALENSNSLEIYICIIGVFVFFLCGMMYNILCKET